MKPMTSHYETTLKQSDTSSKPYRHHTFHHHQQLQQQQQDQLELQLLHHHHLHHVNPRPHCPCVTRSRLLTASTLSLISTLFLLFQCMYPGLLQLQQQGGLLCCRNRNVIRIVYEQRNLPSPSSSDAATADAAVTATVDRLSDVTRKATQNSSGNSSTVKLVDDINNSSSNRSDYDVTDNNIRYRHTRRRLPQCLIIGVRKGGTRALLEFLSLHPAVQAEKQEMHFFDDDANYALGLDWYRRRMRYSFPEQLTVEKTPAYFVGERVPERVRRMNASVRLLVTVRDPVERAISDYMQIHATRLARGKRHARFERLAIDPATGDINRSYKAIRRSIYHRHLARWLAHFPLEQFHFVNGENLVLSPVVELRKVEAFLGLEHKLGEDRFYFNKTRGFYCMRGGGGGNGSARGGPPPPTAVLPSAATSGLDGEDKVPPGVVPDRQAEKCLASSKGRQHPDIDPVVMRKLRRFFRPHNARFYKMMGVDFGWP